MKKSFKSLTTAQFAKLHGVNKRTLHYYDDIGLSARGQREKTVTAFTTPPKAWILNTSACSRS